MSKKMTSPGKRKHMLGLSLSIFFGLSPSTSLLSVLTVMCVFVFFNKLLTDCVLFQ